MDRLPENTESRLTDFPDKTLFHSASGNSGTNFELRRDHFAGKFEAVRERDLGDCLGGMPRIKGFIGEPFFGGTRARWCSGSRFFMLIRSVSDLFFRLLSSVISSGSRSASSRTSVCSKGCERVMLVESSDIRSSNGFSFALLRNTPGVSDSPDDAVDGSRLGHPRLSVILDKSKAFLDGRAWRGRFFFV